MNEHEDKIIELLNSMRELAIEADKGLGIHKLEDMKKLETEFDRNMLEIKEIETM